MTATRVCVYFTDYVCGLFSDWSKQTCNTALTVLNLKFSKVVLVGLHILGEVDTFYTVLLRVYPSICVPIFIEIGLYLQTQSTN